MGYMVIANDTALKPLNDRNRQFGWAPKHPIFEGTAVMGYESGKFGLGQSFEWLGDPTNPPDWCGPADAAAAAAYKAKAARRSEAKSAHRRALEKQLARLNAAEAQEPQFTREQLRAMLAKMEGGAEPVVAEEHEPEAEFVPAKPDRFAAAREAKAKKRSEAAAEALHQQLIP